GAAAFNNGEDRTLQELLHRPYQKGDLWIPLSASIGVAMYPEDGECYEELMYCADSALYEVKASHKGNFAIYTRKEAGGSGD
ncbi:MAG: diguanylate cyclase domain-containing protein, partial [Lachnospiraceae bacterium]